MGEGLQRQRSWDDPSEEGAHSLAVGPGIGDPSPEVCTVYRGRKAGGDPELQLPPRNFNVL